MPALVSGLLKVLSQEKCGWKVVAPWGDATPGEGGTREVRVERSSQDSG